MTSFKSIFLYLVAEEESWVYSMRRIWPASASMQMEEAMGQGAWVTPRGSKQPY